MDLLQYLAMLCYRAGKPKAAPADPRLQPPSTYLIKSAPPRGTAKTKTHVKTNMHIIVDFGLQVGGGTVLKCCLSAVLECGGRVWD